MKLPKVIFSAFLLFLSVTTYGQVVPILSYSVDGNGRVQLEVDASEDNYYILRVRHQPAGPFEELASMTLGVDGPLLITESLGAYPLEHYQVLEFPIAAPNDSDGDGIDDITEFSDMPTYSPLNHGPAVDFIDGTVVCNEYSVFEALSSDGTDFSGGSFLEGREFVKFVADVNTNNPEVYFINMETHLYHFDFMDEVPGFNWNALRGEIIFHPAMTINGSQGVYSFNYSFGLPETFEEVQKTHELIAANMPYLKNNLVYLVTPNGENVYNNEIDDYNNSRIPILFEADIYDEIDYLALNVAEGYGFFRLMELDETPGSKDVVLYETVPNNLPRVAGIMTSFIQTPLSHVNLRAIQNDLPNAFIRDPLLVDSIANLIGSYVYYRVDADEYYIREATVDEVNDWFDDIRPTEPQIPERDLSYTEILPLDSIGFDMSSAFGAKCSNVATMRTFGFPAGTIPQGFGVPFYFYDEFMKYNDFYQVVEDMIVDPDFIDDIDTRIDMLDDLRDDIRAAPMPQWMLDELQAMHDTWPDSTSIRCRSSTNNEDLPGFSGAGLYTSKTQHPDEGHISKSIKQVYASMWNYRAFEERDFYRIDHSIAAMGVLCHPNYEEEKSNGVGVSIDPFYSIANSFYLNTQVGESLVTNPDSNAIPEEMILFQDPAQGFIILRESSLVAPGELVMDEIYLDQMRDYLQVIHDEFAILYDLVGIDGFGMDIEYKVTAEDQLIIKQARPWVSFWTSINASFDLGVVEVTNPEPSASLSDSELVRARIANEGLKDMSDFDISLSVDGQFVETITIPDTLNPQSNAEYQFTVPQDFSTIGDYDIMVTVSEASDGYSNNDTLNYVLSKLHLLEAGISFGQVTPKCNNEIEVNARVTNLGETTIQHVRIIVAANGTPVDTVAQYINIPYLEEGVVPITVSGNLQPTDNEITLTLIRVNNQVDAVDVNNTASTTVDLDSDFDVITLVIHADDWPSDLSYEVTDEITNETLAIGFLDQSDDFFTADFCVDYGSCVSVAVIDAFGDGLCCNYGQGHFLILDSNGDTLALDDGDFGHEAYYLFCLDGTGCAFTADITTTNASDEFASDGTITIDPTPGLDPFQFSIDGGLTYSNDNTFTDLAPGEYMIMVLDAEELCFYEETITLEYDISTAVTDISSDGIRVYPNPTSDNLTIEIEDASTITGTVLIEVYDHQGRLIQTDAISPLGGESRAEITLQDFAAGYYIVKCYNESIERYFRVIKM